RTELKSIKNKCKKGSGDGRVKFQIKNDHLKKEFLRAGAISSALRKALGLGPNDIPEWIYRMRRMGFIKGYPPGYLRKVF
ncbi:unnamed protein product, partial [Dracunculus medinensis]|uniref:PSP domain-containing protein n=1 Tax=Dracunculus medinensis TaxID=318479 RepID=A0A0N4UGP0_DRAME